MAILAAGLALRAATAFLTPALFAPDEAAHVLYAHEVANHLSFPAQTTDAAWAERFGAYEFYQPPLYYVVVAPAYRLLMPWGSAPVYGLRLVNVALSGVLLVLVYRIALTIYPLRRHVASASLALASFLPTMIAVSANVNNDTLVDTLIAGATLVMLISLRAGHATMRTLVMLSALTALALYTKTSAVLLLPTLALWAFGLGRGMRQKVGLFALPACLGLAAIAPWWLLRNQSAYGDLFGVDIHWTRFPGPAVPRLVASAIHLASTFWLSIGRLYDIQPPPFLVAAPVCAVVLLMLAGLTAIISQRESRARPMVYMLGIVLAQVTIAVAAAVGYGYRFRFGEGRYLFAALPGISLLVGSGACFLMRRARDAAPAVLAVSGAGYISVVLVAYGGPGFARVRVVDQVGVADDAPFRVANYETWIAHRQGPLRP